MHDSTAPLVDIPCSFYDHIGNERDASGKAVARVVVVVRSISPQCTVEQLVERLCVAADPSVPPSDRLLPRQLRMLYQSQHLSYGITLADAGVCTQDGRVLVGDEHRLWYTLWERSPLVEILRQRLLQQPPAPMQYEVCPMCAESVPVSLRRRHGKNCAIREMMRVMTLSGTTTLYTNKYNRVEEEIE